MVGSWVTERSGGVDYFSRHFIQHWEKGVKGGGVVDCSDISATFFSCIMNWGFLYSREGKRRDKS